jgi:hypothetical protein
MSPSISPGPENHAPPTDCAAPTRCAGAPPRHGSPSPAVRRTVLALAALLLAVQVGPWYYFQRDVAGYISIARYAAHGSLKSMGSPVLWFPPGYPMLLSPLFHLRELPLAEISVVQWLLAIALMLGINRWAQPQAAEGAVWIAALSVGTCSVWILYRQPMSETAFMAVMAWLAVCFQNLTRTQSRGRFLAWLAAAVALTIALCAIRLVGIAVAAGGSFALLATAWRNRSRHAVLWVADRAVSRPAAVGAALLVSAAAAAVVGGLILQGHWMAQSVGGAATYVSRTADGGGRAILSGYGPWMAMVFSDIGRNTVPFMFKSYGYVGWWWDVNMLIYVPWMAVLTYGYFRWVRRGDDPLAWTLPFFLVALTYFRGDSGARWWVPMTPVFFMCLWFALEPLAQRLSILRAVWLAHVVAASIYWIGVDLPRARSLDQKWPTAHGLAGQITMDRDHVAVDARLAELGWLLDLELDRRVVEHKAKTPVPDSAEWLIIPKDQPPPPEFVARASVGDCELLHRR